METGTGDGHWSSHAYTSIFQQNECTFDNTHLQCHVRQAKREVGGLPEVSPDSVGTYVCPVCLQLTPFPLCLPACCKLVQATLHMGFYQPLALYPLHMCEYIENAGQNLQAAKYKSLHKFCVSACRTVGRTVGRTRPS